MDGLIIKKKWLDEIFYSNKWMEIRGTNTKKRGRIALIESGTKNIVGDVYLTHTMLFRDNAHFKSCVDIHKVNGEMTYPKTWAWCFKPFSAVVYDKPTPYKTKPGAVIWVKDVL